MESVKCFDKGEPSNASVPRRPLGRTGAIVSAIGLGGYHIGVPELSDSESVRLIRAAIDAGIDFMDNCWDYHGGRSEELMGRALQDGYRERVFLMTKIDGRDRWTAAMQLERSMERLRTDRIDLLQFHEIVRHEDPERVLEAGGALEAALEARDAGRVRFVGFTGHKSPDIHNLMLDMAESLGFRFDAVQMPLNVLDASYDSFEQRVLPRLVEQGIAVLGMKPMAAGRLPETGVLGPIECLHYAMSLPTSVVITGCGSMALVEQAAAAGRSFRQLTGEEMRSLRLRAAGAARDGRLEAYKTTDAYDGTSRHPQWLGPRDIVPKERAPGLSPPTGWRKKC
jgi:predicted aldo/keto reductase-like oxidoreductase